MTHAKTIKNLIKIDIQKILVKHGLTNIWNCVDKIGEKSEDAKRLIALGKAYNALNF